MSKRPPYDTDTVVDTITIIRFDANEPKVITYRSTDMELVETYFCSVAGGSIDHQKGIPTFSYKPKPNAIPISEYSI